MSNEGSEISPAELQYFEEHANATRVPNVIVCCSICAFFATVFVALRILGRRMGKRSLRLQANDWFIFIAWAFCILFNLLFALMTRWGGGRHIIMVSNFKMLQIMSVTSESTYAISIAFLKFSILALYDSIFTTSSRRFQVCIWVIAIFISAYTISFVLGTCLQCLPFEAAWNTNIPGGHCISYNVLGIVYTSLNIFTDFVILFLPIPLVRQLHLSKRKKALVMLTFGVGSSACIVSIVRLVYTMQVGSLDGSWTAIPAGYLSSLELAVGFLVGSIPTYRPIYNRIFKKGEYGSNKSSRYGYDAEKNYHPNISAFSNSQLHGYPMHSSHISKVQTTDNGARSGITITDQIELLRHTKGNGDWVRVPDEATSGCSQDTLSKTQSPKHTL